MKILKLVAANKLFFFCFIFQLQLTITILKIYLIGGKCEKFFRNNYKGHIDKIKVGWDHGRGVVMAGVRGEMQTTVFEQQ